MSKTKETLLNSIRHQEHNEDLDWKYDSSSVKKDDNTVNKMWEIKSIKDDCIYKIWAPSYKVAVELLPMIESF